MKTNEKNRTKYNQNLIFGEVSATKGVDTSRSLYQMYGISSGRALLVRQVYNEFKFKVWWYLIFIVLAVACLICVPSSWLNVIELLVCMVSIDLIGRANRMGQIVAMIEAMLYAYISFTNGLYGEVFKSLGINLTLAIFSFVSWTMNLKKQNGQKGKQKELKIKKLSAKGWIIAGSSFAVLIVVAYFVLRALNTTALVLSAITLSISIVCKVLSALCYKENWFLTIIQACISLGLWTNVLVLSITSGTADLHNLPILVLYLAILTNATYSYILWCAMYRKETINGGQTFNMRPVNIKRIAKLRKRYKTLVWKKEIDVAKNS